MAGSVGGVINTGSYPKLLWPGIMATFGMGYDETNQEWKALVDVFNSDKNYEEIVQTVGFGPAPQKPQGQPVEYDSSWQGYIMRATHIAYGLGFSVTYEEQRDNLYKEVATRRSRSLGYSFKQTKETVVANLYNTMGTFTQTPDGVTYINTAHPLEGGGTLANTLTVAADLSEASLEDLKILMDSCTDDRGNRMVLMPKSLIVAPAEQFNAARILKSTFQSGTANNDINALNYMNIFPEGIKMNRYLSNPHAYFIRTNLPDPKTGPILLMRDALRFSQDNEFSTENQNYKGYERYSVALADWRGVYGVFGP